LLATLSVTDVRRSLPHPAERTEPSDAPSPPSKLGYPGGLFAIKFSQGCFHSASRDGNSAWSPKDASALPGTLAGQNWNIRFCHRCPAHNAIRLRSFLPSTRPASAHETGGPACFFEPSAAWRLLQHVNDPRAHPRDPVLGKLQRLQVVLAPEDLLQPGWSPVQGSARYHKHSPSQGRPATLCHLPVLSRAGKHPAAASRSRPRLQCISRKTHLR
jgi:hypothetical protein